MEAQDFEGLSAGLQGSVSCSATQERRLLHVLGLGSRPAGRVASAAVLCTTAGRESAQKHRVAALASSIRQQVHCSLRDTRPARREEGAASPWTSEPAQRKTSTALRSDDRQPRRGGKAEAALGGVGGAGLGLQSTSAAPTSSLREDADFSQGQWRLQSWKTQA
jgi:hypothetical protein